MIIKGKNIKLKSKKALNCRSLDVKELHELWIFLVTFTCVKFCPLSLNPVYLILLIFNLFLHSDELLYLLLLLNFNVIRVGFQNFSIELVLK